MANNLFLLPGSLNMINTQPSIAAKANKLANEIIIYESAILANHCTEYIISFASATGSESNLHVNINMTKPQVKEFRYPPLLSSKSVITITYLYGESRTHQEEINVYNWRISIEGAATRHAYGWLACKENFIIRPFDLSINGLQCRYSLEDTGEREDVSNALRKLNLAGRSFTIYHSAIPKNVNVQVALTYSASGNEAPIKILDFAYPRSSLGISNESSNNLSIAAQEERGQDAGNKAHAGLAIIMPIYSGHEETLSALSSIFESLPKNKTKARLILGLDNPRDQSLNKAIKTAYGSDNRVTILSNESNLGFVGNCNNLYSYVKSHEDILLVNSDIVVPRSNWIDKLYDIVLSNGLVGSVTPLSNQASIFSFPSPNCEQGLLPGLTVDQVDQLLSHSFNLESHELVEVPTCHGFCTLVATSRLGLDMLFNPVFGRGYGEENDLSMRILAKGMLNVACPNTFIYHHESISFAEDKAKLIQANLEILGSLFPSYHGMVRDFIQEDPLREFRNKAVLTYFKLKSSGRDSVIHVSHFRGGGTDKYIQEYVLSRENYAHFAIRPHSKITGYIEILEIDTISRVAESTFTISLSYCELADMASHLFDSLSAREVIIHSLLDFMPFGNRSTGWAGLSEIIKVTIMIHDYHWVCFNENLLDSQGAYKGPAWSPKLHDIIALQVAMLNGRKQAFSYSQPEYLERYRELFSVSHSIIAPSHAAASIIQIYAMSHNLKGLSVRYHDESGSRNKLTSCNIPPLQRHNGIVHVGIIGAIGPNKGLASLIALAEYITFTNLPILLTIIGYTSRDHYLSKFKCIQIIGKYAEVEFSKLAKDAKISCALFLSQWPETYSYTLSLAFQHCLWPIAADIGAPAERIRSAGYGTIVRDTSPNAIADEIIKIHVD